MVDLDVPQRLRQKYPELPLEMRTNEGQQWDLIRGTHDYRYS